MVNIMKEQWLPVVGFDGQYEVSDCGRVRSVDRIVNGKNGGKQLRKGKILAQSKHKNGYAKVSLCVDGVATYHRVHRLVASAFIDNPNNLPCVNHKDENRENNSVDNLEWCTHSYNHLYGTASNSVSKRVKNESTNEVFRSASEAARRYGINADRIRWAARHNKETAGFVWRYV